MRDFLRKHWQALVNVVLVIGLGHWAVEQSARALTAAWERHEFDFVQIAFFLHNVVWLAFILVRRRHQAIERGVLPQCVALVAFFSGPLYVQTPAVGPALLRAAQAVTIAAMLLSTITLVNLGRSFGILIALRKVKTRGLYAVIRHPMYFTDIVWRVGIVLKNPCAWNLAVFVLSTTCYVWRALLEERFLMQHEEYRDYARTVRFRFIPGIF